jgi:hypothetical protein
MAVTEQGTLTLAETERGTNKASLTEETNELETTKPAEALDGQVTYWVQGRVNLEEFWWMRPEIRHNPDQTDKTWNTGADRSPELPPLFPSSLTRQILACVRWKSGLVPAMSKEVMDKVQSQLCRAGLNVYIVEM